MYVEEVYEEYIKDYEMELAKAGNKKDKQVIPMDNSQEIVVVGPLVVPGPH